MTCKPSNDKDKLGHPHNLVGLPCAAKLSQANLKVVLSDLKPGVTATLWAAKFATRPRQHMSLILRKPDFCKSENKAAFVFTTWVVQSLYFLNPKFRACSHLLWLHSLVSVGPGRKPRRPVFSERGSYVFMGNWWQSHKSPYRSFVLRKPVFGVSDQIRQKLHCAVTEDGQRFEISDLGSKGIVLAM